MHFKIRGDFMGQNEIQMNKLLVIFFAFVSNHLDETGKENQESSWCEVISKGLFVSYE